MSDFTEKDLIDLSIIIETYGCKDLEVSKKIMKMVACEHDWKYGYGHFDPEYCCKCGRER